MANITKTQIKSRAHKLWDRIQNLIDGEIADIICELESLKDEVEDESYSIEPYEGYDDLIPEQEERQEWLSDVVSILEDVLSSIEDNVVDALTESQSRLEEVE